MPLRSPSYSVSRSHKALQLCGAVGKSRDNRDIGPAPETSKISGEAVSKLIAPNSIYRPFIYSLFLLLQVDHETILKHAYNGVQPFQLAYLQCCDHSLALYKRSRFLLTKSSPNPPIFQMSSSETSTNLSSNNTDWTAEVTARDLHLHEDQAQGPQEPNVCLAFLVVSSGLTVSPDTADWTLRQCHFTRKIERLWCYHEPSKKRVPSRY